MIFTMFNLGAWSANLSENVCKILYSRGSCKVQWYIKSQEICTEEKRGIKVYRLVCNRLLKMASSLKIRLQTCLYIEPYTKLCLMRQETSHSLLSIICNPGLEYRGSRTKIGN